MRLNVVGVDDLEKNIHDLLLDSGTDGHKLAVNTVQDRLEVVALARVFAVEKFQEAANEVVGDVLDDNIVA